VFIGLSVYQDNRSDPCNLFLPPPTLKIKEKKKAVSKTLELAEGDARLKR
jgi:hypothetical protein